MKEGLEAYVKRLEAQADPQRIAAEVGKEVAAVAAAERGAVARALRAGAALRRLRAVSAHAHKAALRRIWGRSPRSANNYERLHRAYEKSPVLGAAILAAPSLRQALDLLPSTRPGRAPAARSASPASVPPFADADALLRGCAGRGRELRALYEAAAALASGGNRGASAATEAAALTAAVAATFGSADPAVLRTMAARAAATAVDAGGPVADVLEAAPRCRAAAPVAIAGVLVGASAGNACGAVPPDAIADRLEEVADALRALTLPGAEEAAVGGPVALVFEAQAGDAGVPAADVLITAPALAIKAAAPERRIPGTRSPDALAALGVLRHVDGDGRAMFVCAPHTATVRMLDSLGAGAPAMVNVRRDADCVAAASAAAGAAGSRGALGRALRLNDWTAWPEAHDMVAVVGRLLAAAEGTPPRQPDVPGPAPPKRPERNGKWPKTPRHEEGQPPAR